MGQINDKKDVGGFFISAIAALVQANSSLLVIPEAKLLASIVGITTGFCAESELFSFSEALSFTPEAVTTFASLRHTNFLPLAVQVNSLFFLTFICPTTLHLAPALTAALTGTAVALTDKTRMVRTPIRRNFIR